MEFIAYNTKLEIKSIIQEKKDARQYANKQEFLEFKYNKKKLLPYVLKYLHYLVEIHNSIVIKSCFAGGNYRRNVRITSLKDNGEQIILQEILQEFTKDCYFKSNGASYACNIFSPIVGYSPEIWLNCKKGAYVHNRELEYSMTGVNKTYCNSIEDYIQELIEIWINSERAD